MTQLQQISSPRVRLEVSPVGAEMRRLVIDGESILWSGSPDIWSGCAPWLFPVVGKCRLDRYIWQGKTYAMPKHGFALTKVFDCEKSKNALVFTLRDSPETLENYPWRFVFSVTFALTESGVSLTARVQNTDEKEMYYSLGGHPSFLVSDGDRIELEKPETLKLHRLSPDKFLLMPWHGETIKDGVLPLRPSLFDSGAVIAENPRSRGVTIRRQNGCDLSVRFDAVPYCGFWSMRGKGMPYVCVEPWLGVDDSEDVSGQITEKPAIQSLQPGESSIFSISINKL